MQGAIQSSHSTCIITWRDHDGQNPSYLSVHHMNITGRSHRLHLSCVSQLTYGVLHV
jgi:hypothetical protein